MWKIAVIKVINNRVIIIKMQNVDKIYSKNLTW